MDYLGDFSEDSTVYVYFTTSDGSGGAVAPSTAFEAADVNIYKDGSATQKTSTNGLTMNSPFDSITGLHMIEIDTSNDTGDAGFWETGSDYTVVLSPDETVDSQTVVRVLAQFGIENRDQTTALRPTTAGRTLDVAATGEAGVDLGNVTGTLTNSNVGWINGSNQVAGIAGTRNTLDDLNDVSAATVNAQCDQALTDYDAVVPADLPTNFGDLAITATTGRVTIGTNNDKTGYSISGTITTLDGLNNLAEADIRGAVGLAAANLDTQLSNIETDTQDIQSRIPASLNNGAIPADVQRINDVEITGDGSATPFDVP